MRVTRNLAKIAGNVTEHLDPRRWTLVVDLVAALLAARVGTVTELGRALRRPSSDKHAIKRADRALSNGRLHEERLMLWRAIAHYVVRANQQPVVLMDWSDMGGLAVLRAAVAFRGRSITVLSQAYPAKKKGNARAQSSFLQQLADVLPDGCQPVIVVDAGFRVPFFRSVERLGWDFIGRLHSNICLRRVATGAETKASALSFKDKLRDLGACLIRKRRRFPARVIFYDGRSKRARANRSVRCSNPERKARRRNGRPWVLVTSLRLSAKRVVQLYRSRMQIELGFRDDKSRRFGMGVEYQRCSKPQRLDVFLLLLGFATLLLALLGAVVRHRRLDRSMQANTERRRRTLSLITLGRRFLERGLSPPSALELDHAADLIRGQILAATYGDP